MNRTSSFYYFYPLPNLPPKGKELKARLPAWRDEKVGYIEYNESN